ncbi:MAG: xylulokinase [Clostridia bacterium]|nr:xylulokinase [Clostridia bacterium]
MEKKYALGIDFGGGSSKATLIDREGRVVKTASSEYPTHYFEGGGAEQTPRDWYLAAVKNIGAVLEGIDPALVGCVCFDAATHTAVLMGEDGEPVCDSVYWTDTRSAPVVAYLSENYGDEIYRKCKNRVSTIWSLPEILYVRNKSPELFSRVRRVTFAKDYVRGIFTGDFVTDYIEAEGSMLFDPDTMDWDDTLLSLAGLTREMMPRVVSPLDCVGEVTERAARDSGLSVGTPVICGATDTAMEVYAAGAVCEGDATLKLATAGRICVVSSKLVPDKNIVNYSHIKEGLYYPGSATKSCASSLRWFRDSFGGDYRELDRLAEDVPVGSGGLIFHPYLMGELTPYASSELRGSFTGISCGHTKGHFARAVMEGVAMSLLDGMEYLKSRGIVPGSRVTAIGGGARSELWRSIVSDALGITLVLKEGVDSSLGSALLAGVAAGFFADVDSAVRRAERIVAVTEPRPENTEKYKKLHEKYKKISEFLLELTKI